MPKRFEKPRGDAIQSTRSGPRARAAQDRKFGAPRFDSERRPASRPDRSDPYQRAERPARSSFGDRMRMPARGGGVELDPDVARVFRDSEAVNSALRLLIRLARSVSPGARPAFRGSGARGEATFERRPSPRRSARNERSDRGEPTRDPRFDDSE